MASQQRERLDVVRIYNRSKQTIPLQVKPPGGDFYMHEQQVRIGHGQTVLLPKNHLRLEQITNLSARGILKVVYDSETAQVAAE